MKQITTLLIMAFLCAIHADAQTYLQHLQQKTTEKGTVTVNQSKSIDSLVNGVRKITARDIIPNKNTAEKTAKKSPNTPQEIYNKRENTLNKEAESKSKPEEKREETRRKETTRQPVETNEEMTIPTVDMRKKVMTRSYKVNGYRVQAFMGGNTRADHRKAEQISNAIKMKFPDEPVYVHFYSPRWVCRVGNYRSYEEASRMLKQIKAMGYQSATILKGKITVQY